MFFDFPVFISFDESAVSFLFYNFFCAGGVFSSFCTAILMLEMRSWMWFISLSVVFSVRAASVMLICSWIEWHLSVQYSVSSLTNSSPKLICAVSHFTKNCGVVSGT